MCVVCILLDKDKITKREALKALWEEAQMVDSYDGIMHLQEKYGELEEQLYEEESKND